MTTEEKTREIREQCVLNPLYEDGSAYQRTKICCDVLMRRGEPIPSWMVIRDYIGKGSATDIRRAVGDFRVEHADLLRQMHGVPASLPERLAPAVSALWQAAVAEATDAMAAQAAQAQEAVEAAEARATTAEDRQAAAMADLALRDQQVAALQDALRQAVAHAETERSARQQAERTMEAHVTDLTAQRASLQESMNAVTAQLQAITKRAEGERHRALMEIEHARQQVVTARQEALHEGERRLAAREAELRKELANLNIEFVHLQRKHGELQQQAAKLRALVKADTAPKARRRSATRIASAPAKRVRLRTV